MIEIPKKLLKSDKFIIMQNQCTKLIPEDVIMTIMEEAKNTQGTWSFSFLQKLQEELKYFDQKRLDRFVGLLLTEAEQECNENAMKLKIAQLLSTLKSFFLPGIVFSINTHNKRIVHIADSIPNGKLSDSTKRMFLNLIQSNCVQPISCKVKSNSAQPYNNNEIFFNLESSQKLPI